MDQNKETSLPDRQGDLGGLLLSNLDATLGSVGIY